MAQVAQHARLVAGVAPLSAHDHLIGPAFPCSCAPRDNLGLHHALMTAPAGSVLVCAVDARLDGGYFGELMATDAVQRRLAGLVIDGSVRDTNEIRDLGFPVFAGGVNPFQCDKKTAPSVGEPVVLAGTVVRLGDIVVGDADGVVVVPWEDWAGVEEAAQTLQANEASTRSTIEAGTTLATHLALPTPPNQPTR